MADSFIEADLAIIHGTVVTVDDAASVHEDGLVLIRGGALAHVGNWVAHHATRTIDAAGGIVIPGLINTHAHLAMTLFRGLADDCDLAGFLAKILPAEAAIIRADTVALGTELAIAECFRSGITTSIDMYFFPEAAHEVAARTGFRLHSGPTFIEFPGPDNMRFEERCRWAEKLVARSSAGSGTHRWLSPHSTYLLSPAQLRTIAAMAADLEARVHVHACETKVELEQVRRRHHRTPIEVLAEVGLLGERTLLAHSVHLNAADIELIAQAKTSVAHCPASNLKLASGVAPIAELVAAGVNVALGTDGPASGNDLDLWLAMRLTAYVQKVTRHDAAVLPAAQLVAMATRHGARALGIEHVVGSLEVGKRADVVVLDNESPSLMPRYDAHSTVAYAAGRGDVRWVLADGHVVVDDRNLTTIDLGATAAALTALTPTIAASVA